MSAVLEQGVVVVPGFEVIEHLSRGAALDVYDAWSLERDCRCVIKVARPDRGEARVRRRLVLEGELLLALSHPHIVRAYELVRRPRTALVLETLQGRTLANMVETLRRRLSATDLAFLGVHLCSAVSYLHGHGYLHLDLKPSNVIVDNAQAKLIDLSLARPPGRGRRGVGTRAYMAPEQARGRVLGEATDVWGLGAVLHEAATGAPPFPVSRNGHYPQLEGRAAPLSETRRAPRRLTELVSASLDPEPSGRPSVTELRDGLDTLLD